MPRRRRARRFLAAVAIVVLLLVVGTVAGAWFGVAAGIDPKHPVPHGFVPVLAVDHDSVTLPATDQTAKPGHWGLMWYGGGTRVGEVVARGLGTVRRTLEGDDAPALGGNVQLVDSLPGDPKTALGLAFSEIAVATPLGPAPAWYVPAAGPRASTFAIVVHGTNAFRNSGLRVLPALHRTGLPTLLMSQRNDTGAPPSPDGVMHAGATEWQDLEAAVRTAQSLGAQRIVLVGESAGASIVGRFLAHSPLAPLTTAVVFDSPLVSIPSTARFTFEEQYHLPSLVTSIGWPIYRMRTGDDPDQIDMLTHPPAVRPTTLMLVAGADREHPVSAMRALAAAGPGLGWPIRYEEFPDAGHNLAWNSDPARYDRLVSAFVDRTVPVRS